MTLPVSEKEINVGCLWREERLVVELDRRSYHRENPGAFTRDRPHRPLRLAGHDPGRFTDEEIEYDPDEVIATVLAVELGAATRRVRG